MPFEGSTILGTILLAECEESHLVFWFTWFGKSETRGFFIIPAILYHLFFVNCRLCSSWCCISMKKTILIPIWGLPSCSGWLCFLCLLGSSQDLLLGVIFKGLFHPFLLLVMTFFGLDGVAAAVFFVLLSLISLLLRFLCAWCPCWLHPCWSSDLYMLAMFKDFALLDLLEGCAPSLLVLCLCMFNAEVPLMPTFMQHGPLFGICELVASQQY